MKKQFKMSLPFTLIISLVVVTVFATFIPGMQIKAESTDITNVQGIVGPYTLDESELDVEVYQINLSTAEQVDNSIISQEELNKASSTEGVVSVVDRDWSQYSSDTFRSNMSSAELTYYDRLITLAEYYMVNSTIDAYYVAAYDMYAVNGVVYSDLGLTSTEAFLTTEWFLYNNPQYYFLKPKLLTTSQAIYLGCYNIVADGDDRATMTNLMFSMIDDWIASVNDDEVTNYDKVLSAHTLVCNQLDYISNEYDQSLYSAVILGETVCAGYSELMSVMLNASGVDTMVCLNDCHAWNLVMLDDNNYYGVDATWDDGLHSQLFMACGYDTLVKYDTSLNEHVMGSYWTDWVPDISLTNYDNVTNAGSEIVVDTPTLSIEKIDNSSIRIKWSSVPLSTKYEIEVYNSNTNALLGKKTTTSTSLKLTNISENATLYIRCRAAKSVSGVVFYSNWSELTYTGNDVSNEVEEVKPEPITVDMPSGLLASNVDEVSAILTWNSVENLNHYTFEVYSDEGYTNLLLSNDRTSNRVVLKNLVPGRTYYIRVCAVRYVDGTAYMSDWNNLSFTTLEPVVIDVVEPSNLGVESITANSGKVTWTSVPNASKYQIEISSVSDFSNILVSGNVTSTRVNIKSLQHNTTYYARVRTMQVIDGETMYSDWVSTQFTTIMSVDKITNLTSSFVSDTASRLTWTAVPNATSYEVNVYSDASRTNLLVAGNVRGSSLKLSGLVKGNTYYVAIRTVVNDGVNVYYSDWVEACVVK